VRKPVLTHDLVHQIRVSGLPDTHWERELGVPRVTVQKARVGVTWTTHPTPPDRKPRAQSNPGGGRPQENRLPTMSKLDRKVSVLLAKWPRVVDGEVA
jgi:hypothetical protein